MGRSLSLMEVHHSSSVLIRLLNAAPGFFGTSPILKDLEQLRVIPLVYPSHLINTRLLQLTT